jgi:ATP-dependent DNA ligase
MQCKPASSLPTGEKWVFEIKFDGYRCIVVKRLGSIYEPGERSGAWIKLRANLETGVLVIGGYLPGARVFDALLLGVYENKRLKFVAKVKNGFVPRIRDELFPALKALQTAPVSLQESA